MIPIKKDDRNMICIMASTIAGEMSGNINISSANIDRIRDISIELTLKIIDKVDDIIAKHPDE